MQSVNIAITDEGALDIRSNEPIGVQDILALTLNAQLAVLNKVLEEAPEDIKEDVKKDLFDMYNLGASNILAAFAPEFEVHPELDVHEMLAEENAAIDSAYAAYEKVMKETDAS